MSRNNGMMIAQNRVSSAESIDRLSAPPHHGPHGGHRPRGGFRGGRGHAWDRSAYYYPVEYESAIDDEVAFYERRNARILLRRQGETNQIRDAVVNTLKSHGWTEAKAAAGGIWLLPPGQSLGQANISTWGQPNVMVVEDVDHWAAWTPTKGSPYGRRPAGAYVGEVEVIPDHDRPSMLVELGRIGRLGQIRTPYTVRAEVKDVHGRPFPGVTVQVVAEDGANMEGETNSNGAIVFTFPTSSESIEVAALLPEGPSPIRSIRAISIGSEIVSFRSVEAAPQAIVNTLEAAAGGGGLAIFLLGLALKSEPLQVLGEIGFIAAVFNRVGRAL